MKTGIETPTGESTGYGPGTGLGRPRGPIGHRTGPGFFEGGSTGHRTGPGFFGGGPTGRTVTMVPIFFVDFNLAHNETPERGGREELKLESQEGQELSTDVPASQLVLNMNSEDQTVDHTNMLMGNDHDTIFIDFSEYGGQEDTNFENRDQRVNDCVQTSY